MDYTKQTPPEFETIKVEQYVEGLLGLTTEALERVQFDTAPKLSMAETRMRLNYRVPDAQTLQWARQIVEPLGDRFRHFAAKIAIKPLLIRGFDPNQDGFADSCSWIPVMFREFQ
jgi:hypothetical protein